ncbi:MAG: CRISPR-associated endonuclease Cas1 [Proteobacteria bacterium]|nr:CRISPR-associated endonuclease Cas1 [Pseudomonadota bacterium]
MQSLFVVEHDAIIGKRGEEIVVKIQDIVAERAQLASLSQCVVLGNAALTTPAVKAMLKNGVDVVFMHRGGGFLGRLTSGRSRNILLRKKQFHRLSDPAHQLALATSCVRGKIENQRRLLARFQKRRPSTELSKALVALRLAKQRVDSARDLDTLRGVEGSAAAAYFAVFGTLITAPNISFTKRLRRPPPDPVNILLSFGYTQLGNNIHAMIESAGLDPYLGGLHAPQYGRPSLVLDLIEEFRPVIVDSAVIRALNTGAISHRDFQWIKGDDATAEERLLLEDYSEDGDGSHGEDATLPPPVIFGKTGIRKWVGEYQRRLNEMVYYPPRGLRLSLQHVMRAQVHHLARCIDNDQAYMPWLSPR